MMNKRLYKTYVKLSNIVMRISNGTSEGKEHAILVNSHLDSTLPSPGAADDAISVGVSFYPLFFFTFLVVCLCFRSNIDSVAGVG